MVITKHITVQTNGGGQVLNINAEFCRQVAESGLSDGIVTVFVAGTTAAISIMEHEPGLVADLQATMDRLIPREIPYQHDLLNNDDNGYAHTQASLLGPSLVVPFAAKRPLLGTWQQIILVDFDSRPRNRQIVFQIMGE